MRYIFADIFELFWIDLKMNKSSENFEFSTYLYNFHQIFDRFRGFQSYTFNKERSRCPVGVSEEINEFSYVTRPQIDPENDKNYKISNFYLFLLFLTIF